jgi:RHS repeat-associated protein
VVSHILRNRTIKPSTGVATDRWFHYDQVGSVLSESDAAGALAQTHHQDAFGNTQAAWQTGLWGGDRAGWHHNTKELDGDTGLVYMYQRWYAPETGTFMSSAPYPVTMEHRYGFAENRPGLMVDPDGRCPGGSLTECLRRAQIDFLFNIVLTNITYAHVLIGCAITAAFNPLAGALCGVTAIIFNLATIAFFEAVHQEQQRRCRVDCTTPVPPICPGPPLPPSQSNPPTLPSPEEPRVSRPPLYA